MRLFDDQAFELPDGALVIQHALQLFAAVIVVHHKQGPFVLWPHLFAIQRVRQYQVKFLGIAEWQFGLVLIECHRGNGGAFHLGGIQHVPQQRPGESDRFFIPRRVGGERLLRQLFQAG